MKFQINKIYNEDCVVGMKNIPSHSIDNILTSPPYNTNRNNMPDRGYDLYQDGMSNEDYSKWTCSIFKEFDRILKNDGCVLWNMSYGSENIECMPLTIADIIRETGFTVADIIVWKKLNAFPNSVSPNKLTRICEFVYVLCRKSEISTFLSNKKVVSERANGQRMYENISNFIEAPNNDESTDLNKATFSTGFVERLIDVYIKPHSVILDCFMGTGTTAIGCINRNVNFVGFEISKKQCEYAEQRIKKRLQQQSLFDEIDYLEEKYIKNSLVEDLRK